MPRYRVTITGRNYDAMAGLIRKHRLNIAGHTGKKPAADVYEAGKRRQAEVRTLAGRTPSSKRRRS
jgi:hypothetical protein